MSTSSDEEKTTADVNAPILIDLGKHKRKWVKRLKKGKPGRLMDEVKECITELQNNDTIPSSAQPVIIVVREKRKRRRWGW